MGLRNRARRVYARHKEGTYQTRDTSNLRNAQRPAPVVHEDITPDAPFDPLLNHQGAPTYNPVTNTTTEDEDWRLTDTPATEDEGDQFSYKIAEQVITCGVLAAITICMAIAAVILIGLYNLIF